MPIFDLQPNDISGVALPDMVAKPDAPKLEGSLMGAAGRQEFAPASLIAFNEGRPGALTPQELDELDSGKYKFEEHMLPGHEEYEEEYAKYATSPRHAAWLSGTIERERRDRQLIEEGGIPGFLAMGVSAMASPEQWPTYFIPGALLLKGGVMTGSRATIIGTEVGVATTGATIGEAALHGSQITRTKQESAFAIAGSAVFAGLLTGAVIYGKGGMRKGEEVMSNLDAEQRALQEQNDIMDKMDPQSMGAAHTKDDIVEIHRTTLERAENDLLKATEGGDPNLIAGAKAKVDELSAMKPGELTELKHPKLAKALMWASPAVRVAGSRVSSAREMMTNLVDDALLRKGHAYGTSFDASIESKMAVFEESMGHKLMDVLDPTYKAYRTAAKEAGQAPLPREKFMAEISIAAREGDKHADEFVSKAAKVIRSEITDPIRARLDAQDMLDRQVTDYSVVKREDLEELMEADDIDKFFKEDGTPKASMKNMPADVRDTLVAQGKLQTEIRTPVGDETYLHRLWDFEAVKLDPIEFDRQVSEYLNTKTTEASFEETIGAVSSRADQLNIELAALDAKLTKSKNKTGKVVERSHAEYRAEVEGYKAQRKALREAGDDKAADKIKVPKRTHAQTAHDLRQEIKHINEIELPKAKIKHDANVKHAVGTNKMLAQGWRAKIEGSSYTPTHGSDVLTFQSGVLKGRSLNIPTNVVKDFVENDIEKVLHHYVKGVNAQLHFKEKFDPSSPGIVKVGKDPQDIGVKAFDDKMSKISDEFEAERMRYEEAGNHKEAQNVLKEKDRVIEDLKAMQQILFDKYKLPDNPSGFWNQARARLKEFNMVTMLGMMTISALPDIGNYIARRGLKSFARDMARFATNYKAIKASAQMNRRMGLSSDMMSMSRVEALYAGGGDNIPISKRTTGGKVLRGWKNAHNAFTQATLMPIWNNTLKNMSATSIIDDLLIDATKFKAGKLSPKKIEQYSRFGFGSDEMDKLVKELDPKRDMIDGVWIPDVDKWGDQELAQRFKAAVHKEVDMTVVTPGAGDLPLAGRNELGKIVLQFKSFMMAANNRILGASLDDFTADKVAGAVVMTMLGYTSYATRQALKGKDIETDYDTFVREGLDRSGMMAIPGEINAILSKLTGGGADMYRLTGADKKVLTRYASRNMLSTIAGVSGGRVQDFGQLMSAVASGDYTQSDISAMRRTLYMNNHFALHYGLTQVEKSLGGSK